MSKSCFNCANKEEIYNNGEEDVVVCEINRYTENIYPREAEAVAEKCIAYQEEPQTNEQWLCGLSTEEKADLLFGTFYLAGRNDEKRGDWKGVDTIMEWLKQPHTTKE